MSQFSDVRRAPPSPKTTRSRLRRFSRSAKGYWTSRGSGEAWLLTVSLVAVVFASLGITYAINLWNRHFFDALEAKDASVALHAETLRCSEERRPNRRGSGKASAPWSHA